MHLKLVSCEIFYREMCTAIARSPNKIDVTFLPKGLHDIPCHKMLARVQAAVDEADADDCDAVVMGYGLCNNGLNGLAARTHRLVVPRAHDCITLFLGSSQRYKEYFFANPGVYFNTTGWMERNGQTDELSQLSIAHDNKMDQSYEDLVEKYGEENAKFLYDELYQHTRNYSQYSFIEMGVEPDDSFERRSEEQARERGWGYEKLQGDMSMIRRLLDGEWNDGEFLVVPPGHRVAAHHDDGIIAAKPGPAADAPADDERA